MLIALCTSWQVLAAAGCGGEMRWGHVWIVGAPHSAWDFPVSLCSHRFQALGLLPATWMILNKSLNVSEILLCSNHILSRFWKQNVYHCHNLLSDEDSGFRTLRCINWSLHSRVILRKQNEPRSFLVPASYNLLLTKDRQGQCVQVHLGQKNPPIGIWVI